APPRLQRRMPIRATGQPRVTGRSRPGTAALYPGPGQKNRVPQKKNGRPPNHRRPPILPWRSPRSSRSPRLPCCAPVGVHERFQNGTDNTSLCPDATYVHTTHLRRGRVSRNVFQEGDLFSSPAPPGSAAVAPEPAQVGEIGRDRIVALGRLQDLGDRSEPVIPHESAERLLAQRAFADVRVPVAPTPTVAHRVVEVEEPQPF